MCLCTSLRPSLDGLSPPQLPTAICVGGFRCSGLTPALLVRLLLWPGLSVHRKVAVGSAQARGTSGRSAISGVGEKGWAWPGEEGQRCAAGGAGLLLPHVAPCLVSRV